MAEQPVNYPEWATDEVLEVKVIDGITTVLNNTLEPNPEWKLSGQKFEENTPRQYLNYQFNAIDLWVKHLDERYKIGDVHLTTSVESVANISIRLGGTWVARGTEGIGSIVTVFVYEKTA
jgi:hypothetical protein